MGLDRGDYRGGILRHLESRVSYVTIGAACGVGDLCDGSEDLRIRARWRISVIAGCGVIALRMSEPSVDPSRMDATPPSTNLGHQE
jgi:hypothetical protein